jgi:hypothetical protein
MFASINYRTGDEAGNHTDGGSIHTGQACLLHTGKACLPCASRKPKSELGKEMGRRKRRKWDRQTECVLWRTVIVHAVRLVLWVCYGTGIAPRNMPVQQFPTVPPATVPQQFHTCPRISQEFQNFLSPVQKFPRSQLAAHPGMYDESIWHHKTPRIAVSRAVLAAAVAKARFSAPAKEDRAVAVGPQTLLPMPQTGGANTDVGQTQL